MNSKVIFCVVLSYFVVLSSSCSVKSSSYTTDGNILIFSVLSSFVQLNFLSDELVLANQVGYITSFTLLCKNQINNIPLFAEVNGQISPVFRIKEEYQFSFTEEKQKSGHREVKLYDEEQFATYRKSQRAGETPSVKPLATIQINFSRGFGSNFLISSELVVLSLSFFVAYIAFQNRLKLVN